MRALAGTSGVVPPLSTAVDGQRGMYTTGACSAGLSTLYPGPRLLYALDLGEATPLGGTLTLTTCGHSANNTVLYVGVGCPTWAMPFGCLAGNDDAPAVGPGSCGGNRRASSVAVAATQRVLYVQLGGANGELVTSGLSWRYAAASRSASGTRSRTRSRSGTRTRSKTGSRSGSRSRSRKAKL
jgi:hypothetical protein